MRRASSPSSPPSPRKTRPPSTGRASPTGRPRAPALADSALRPPGPAAAALDLRAAGLGDKLKAVDAYVAPVELTPQRVLPGNLRERIRCNGPTVALPGER